MDPTTELSATLRPRLDRGQAARGWLSLATVALVWLVLACTFLLMSPPGDARFPGAVSWSAGSWLKSVVDLLSVAQPTGTQRGVAVKDLALHLGAALVLLILAIRAAVSAIWPPPRRTRKDAWFFAQVMFGAWVALSVASVYWSQDAPTAFGQAALYALLLAWAVGLAWTVESRDISRALFGYVALAAIAAALCVWHFHERNPYHRPGFPLGNPNSLAGSIFPAILIGIWVVIGYAIEAYRSGRLRGWATAAFGGAALIPLLWCFSLTRSRAATIGLLAGFVMSLVLGLPKRARGWVLVIGIAAVVGLSAWFASNTEQLAMARGATVRFRFYAWRYAATLWSVRPISGFGAGTFPRLSNGLASWDRALDPAAFQGDLIGHAHNELFEILAEIGLFGGVTFVAGAIATIAAAAHLLRSNLSPQRRCWMIGMVAGLVGLFVDSLGGVTLRLPGPPAVMFMLIGLLWAVERAHAKSTEPPPTESMRRQRMLVRRWSVVFLALLASVVSGALAIRGWSGARDERSAAIAFADGEPLRARQLWRRAAVRLLDPSRILLARERALAAEFDALLDTDPRSVTESAARAEFELSVEGFVDRARAFMEIAPAYGEVAKRVAQACQLRANLAAPDQPEDRSRWAREALEAWRIQLRQTPYDRTTLLALTQYPLPLGERVGCLRDALRAGFVDGEWYAAFQRIAAEPGFDRIIDVFRAGVGTYTPETNIDNLVWNGPAEALRLSAVVRAEQAEFAAAAEDAGRAAALYQPLRARAPELYSVALAEQAEYAFRAHPLEAQPAVELIEQALDALPSIQTQKAAARDIRYVRRLARYLIAADREAEALDALRKAGLSDAEARDELMQVHFRLAQSLFAQADALGGRVEQWLGRVIDEEPQAAAAWILLVERAAQMDGAAGVKEVVTRAQRAGLAPEALTAVRNAGESVLAPPEQ